MAHSQFVIVVFSDHTHLLFGPFFGIKILIYLGFFRKMNIVGGMKSFVDNFGGSPLNLAVLGVTLVSLLK